MAMKVSHDKGITHQDIRLKNAFLLSDGTVKLCDFGIPGFVDSTVGTEPEFTKDVLYYLPPEVYMQMPLSMKSDIWSLGILLYKMCSGQFPIAIDNYFIYMSEIIDFAIPIKIFECSNELNSLMCQILVNDSESRLTVDGIMDNVLCKEKVDHFTSLPESQPISSEESKSFSLEEVEKIHEHYKSKINLINKNYKKMLDEQSKSSFNEESKFESHDTGVGTSTTIEVSELKTTSVGDSNFDEAAVEDAVKIKELKAFLESKRGDQPRGFTSYTHNALILDLRQQWTEEVMLSIVEGLELPKSLNEIDVRYLDEDFAAKTIAMVLQLNNLEIDEFLVNVYYLPKYESDHKLDFTDFEKQILIGIANVRKNIFLHNFEMNSTQFVNVSIIMKFIKIFRLSSILLLFMKATF